MDISEIVEKINNGEKVGEVAKEVGISQSTLSRKLKNEGYNYDNKNKIYVRKNSENSQNKVVSNSELSLTDDEINFVKNSYQRLTFFEKDFEISWNKTKLPPRKPEKKTPYIISQQTFNEFKEFAESLENEYRVTQNELVEIALRKLMKEWGQ